ncbi:hypothetical protein SLS59_009613 [Nothophoma quercina]|uniref:Major facilitator superfamily (MFS) profile domain-containing protein n=1 Tax=Nothophoma quercina TaxID=749835 RepID=A0ABR3QK36_9PLEO
MATPTVVPTDRELKVIDLSSSDTQDLIREAEANDAADRALTVMGALKKYKKAVFWAMFLSTSLIMEGYDVVIFLERFGVPDGMTGKKLITPAWQSGLTNSALVARAVAYIKYTTELEKAETENASYLECFKGVNVRRTEINCVVWAAQILCGNAILGYSVLFLQQAGFSEVQAFNVNISLSACYIVGGIICWFLFPHFGRATIYMSGMAIMFVILIVIGGLGFASGTGKSLAIGILLVFSTLVNMITIGPVCYPIVAETPSGRLRYKTVCIGRFVYNLTGLFHNSVTPRMLSPIGWNWGAKAALFYAGTNLLCNIWCWFRLPETKDRPFGEIDLLFENKVSARKFKYTSVDRKYFEV